MNSYSQLAPKSSFYPSLVIVTILKNTKKRNLFLLPICYLLPVIPLFTNDKKPFREVFDCQDESRSG